MIPEIILYIGSLIVMVAMVVTIVFVWIDKKLNFGGKLGWTIATVFASVIGIIAYWVWKWVR